MLKAVRFDPEEHKDLLDFVANFTDRKGKKNESEAIRFLMIKGLEALNGGASPSSQPEVDVNKITADVYSKIMASLPQFSIEPYIKTVGQLIQESKIPVQQPVQSTQQTVVEEAKEELVLPPPLPQASSKKMTNPNNPLLANLLGNVKK